ncbi:MAG: 23S rRNA (pseudouridine(1915)-N(3))-methyltransferase RlmH [Betaproteobacteria bacterium RIFCSPLOWO2_02_FULL_65_24]|nr:MAG: 23S rRNA (pseudouridine(1915)-N(3))-methyltransferase RlmH [Betaproteobacteria bacterium RIFCSPLOWO2_02_FULL_65_24]
MKLVVVAVGTRMPSWVADGYREYAKRMPPGAALELVEIKPEARTSGKTVAQMLAAEAARIRAALPKGGRVIALDERGKDLSTTGLAVQIEAWMQERGPVVFLIGGADGLDAALKKTAAMQLRLSAMTLPHGLARVLLAEQLYRALSIIGGHPYHRE